MSGDNPTQYILPAPPPAVDDLRHARFVDNLIMLKGQKADAYLTAGYKVKSKAVAAANASRLLKNAKVQALLVYRLEQLRAKEMIEVRQARVIRELNRLAYSDLRSVIQWDEHGHLTITPSDQLTPDQAASIKKFKVNKRTTFTKDGDEVVDQTIEIELHDKKGPLEILARIGKLVDNNKPIAAVSLTLNMGGLADGGDRRKPVRRPDIDG